jgi:antirestriction protein ArdC
MSSNDAVYAVMTDAVLKLLEAGIVFWRKPWKGPSDAPQNLWAHLHNKRGGHYNGGNVYALHGRRLRYGYASPWWLTIKQVDFLGGHVRESEYFKNGGVGSGLVIYWKILQDKRDPDKKIPFRRFTQVFHVEQCEGLDGVIPSLEIPQHVFTPVELAEQFIANRHAPAAPITHDGGNRAYYKPSSHTIHMPSREYFFSTDSYYATLFHEVGHSTGHTSNLDRGFKHDAFGSDPYAIEELVAEMFATRALSDVGLESTESQEASAAYLAGWVKQLRDHKDMLWKAAALAEKAYSWITSAPEEVVIEEEEELAA